MNNKAIKIRKKKYTAHIYGTITITPLVLLMYANKNSKNFKKRKAILSNQKCLLSKMESRKVNSILSGDSLLPFWEGVRYKERAMRVE
jgi:hypothetical protein